MNTSLIKELRDLSDKYQRMYGPLSIYFPCNSWINGL